MASPIMVPVVLFESIPTSAISAHSAVNLKTGGVASSRFLSSESGPPELAH